MDIKDKKVVVIGLAKSGTTIAKILHRLGANVVVNDAKNEAQCTEKRELESLGITVICNGHPDNLIDGNVSLVVKNPGIPYSISPIVKAESLNIPVVTEVEVASQLTEAPIIGITGSNGKTTTTTLVGEILKESNLNPIVAGNIGTVLSEKAIGANSKQVLVTELSSFQLKGTRLFRPHIAVLLNIYPAHLDYHQTIDDYIKSKSNLFKNQTTQDFAVLNSDCKNCMEIGNSITSKIYLFSTKHPVERGAYVENEKLIWFEDDIKTEILSISKLLLKGEHNLENILAAIIASKLYGASFEAIKKVLTSFNGVEHRLEYVKTTNNDVTYYNDSKATNPTATITALKSFTSPVFLIAGGLDRGIDFKELIEPFKKHVKGLIVYGQTAQKLSKIGEIVGLQSIHTVDNVTNAVELSSQLAQKDDVVLLSPACASWDMFSSFEERGSIFKKAVHKL